MTPARRTDQLIVRQAGDGLVAYALDTHQVTELDPLTAKVWRNLDGAATTEGIARAIDLDELEVAIAVDRLDRAGLMAGGVDRRRFLRFATAAAGAMSLVSITAPTAMAAGSAPAPPPPLLNISSSCANANNPANARVTGFVSGTGFAPNSPVAGQIQVIFDGGIPGPVTLSFSDTTNASGAFRTRWTTGLVRRAGGKTYTANAITTLGATPAVTASLSGLTCT